MAQLVPYLHFNGNCREAMEFYKSVLGGELQIQTMGESPMAQMMPEQPNNVLHSALMLNGSMFMMASDMSDPNQKEGHSVSLCLVCTSKEEIETLFAKLSEGGSVPHPLKEEFFGTFGDVQDKYGYRWMLQFGMGQG